MSETPRGLKRYFATSEDPCLGSKNRTSNATHGNAESLRRSSSRSAMEVIDLNSDSEDNDADNSSGDVQFTKLEPRSSNLGAVNGASSSIENSSSKGNVSEHENQEENSEEDEVIEIVNSTLPTPSIKSRHPENNLSRKDKDTTQKEWGALLAGSKRRAVDRDDSLLEAMEPTDKWGMVVDSKWRAEYEQLTPVERNIVLTLRYLALEATGPFMPAFGFSDGISEQAFRPPGSGSYSFDGLRAPSRYQHHPALAWQVCAPNLLFCVQTFLQLSSHLIAGVLQPEVDELSMFLKKMITNENVGKPTAAFKTLSALMYCRTRWVAEEDLIQRWHLDQDTLSDTLSTLKQGNYIQTRPSTFADCLDLLNTQTRGVLYQLKLIQKSSLNTSSTKRQILVYIEDQGLSFARKLCESLETVHVRLQDETRRNLHRCLVHIFAKTGYSSDDTRFMLRHIPLDSYKFAGSPKDATNGAYQTDKEVPKAEESNADIISGRLRVLQQREDFFKAVELSGKLSLYAAHGDSGNAYRVLHEAADRLLRMLEGAAPHQLRELHALARVCLTGCQLLQRERRYADAEHYLQMVVKSTGHHPALVMVHCEALGRLAQDLEHRGAKAAALRLGEDALKRDHWILGCKLPLAKETPNRLGGTGVAIMSRYVRLSVPPRRWRLVVKEAAQLHQPVFIKIEAECEAREVQQPRDAQSVSSFSTQRFMSKPAWKTASSVEDVVLEHFKRHGNWQGVHCENGFGITSYTLLFWDLLFDERAPHAESNSAFVELPRAASDGTWLMHKETRQAIEERLANILDESSGHAFVAQCLESAWPKANVCHARGVNLSRLSLDETKQVFAGMSLRTIAMICALFAENYKAWNGGLPDLMLWRVAPAKTAKPVIGVNNPSETQGLSSSSSHADKTMETRFIEVKGPGDSLSERQKAWIDKLTQVGANITVCNVKAVSTV